MLSRLLSIFCITSLLTGAAIAAPVALLTSPFKASITTATEVALVMKGTRAGNMKQRHRTRLDRCRNTPSRC